MLQEKQSEAVDPGPEPKKVPNSLGHELSPDLAVKKGAGPQSGNTEQGHCRDFLIVEAQTALG